MRPSSRACKTAFLGPSTLQAALPGTLIKLQENLCMQPSSSFTQPFLGPSSSSKGPSACDPLQAPRDPSWDPPHEQPSALSDYGMLAFRRPRSPCSPRTGRALLYVPRDCGVRSYLTSATARGSVCYEFPTELGQIQSDSSRRKGSTPSTRLARQPCAARPPASAPPRCPLSCRCCRHRRRRSRPWPPTPTFLLSATHSSLDQLGGFAPDRRRDATNRSAVVAATPQAG